jgi:hypothetical protein
LKELYLQHNQITKLDDGTLNPLENLEEMSLYNNLIALVESSSFRNNKKLKIIHLGKNKIVAVDPMIFKNIPSLETLNMKENICGVKDFTGINEAITFCTKMYEHLESKKLLNAIRDGMCDQPICEECSTPEYNCDSQVGSNGASIVLLIFGIILCLLFCGVMIYLVITIMKKQESVESINENVNDNRLHVPELIYADLDLVQRRTTTPTNQVIYGHIRNHK